jgi:hypothetical protein
MILATQSPRDARVSRIRHVIRDQAPTQFYFANGHATREDLLAASKTRALASPNAKYAADISNQIQIEAAAIPGMRTIGRRVTRNASATPGWDRTSIGNDRSRLTL